ncbi:putative p-loop containing nucleoside triphosphate hydrolases superfamily protein [Melia azedarach]|uniref:P-loop containing nucleoside triphosphate hydrolases superfamily protein n=1 Tax=Melia azedarach TaxID=155640 RepID=A0ACC1XHY5_MELAZ|nr:putative p-loop containing nucleoside triphosphate hydrolases superfamily protein [Melia azedarach]
MFRANAAFREVDGVPVDIYSMCAYDGECFSLPSHGELKQFMVISSTFATSFSLLDHGITAGHFSSMFLVDSSSATEPETMITLSSFANENTTVILTGAPNNRTGWVRSDIARNNGLRMSYFERLRASNIYTTSNPTLNFEQNQMILCHYAPRLLGNVMIYIRGCKRRSSLYYVYAKLLNQRKFTISI